MKLTEPEISEMPARSALVLAKDFTVETRSDIPAFYNEFWQKAPALGDLRYHVTCGISFNLTGKGTFRYGIGVIPHELPSEIPEEFETVELYAGTYAIFRAFGPPTMLPQMFDAIYEQWLPTSGYAVDGHPVIERYPEDPRYGPDGMATEIWAPVQKK